ncbi:MAG: matrixin family metalloprotease [Nitrosopumilaceae archaeon]
MPHAHAILDNQLSANKSIPNKIVPLLTKSISSPNTGYKIDVRDDGTYGIVPIHKSSQVFSWDTPDNKTLNVSIMKLTPLSVDQISSVKKAIVGHGTVKFNDYETFVSWNDALQNAFAYQSDLVMPTNLELVADDNNDADVVIYVTDEKNPIYSGYTSNVVENNKIVKSNIIIYDINGLDDQQISSIVRHEFGHSLGLMHSGSENDLMFGTVPVPSYVSDRNVAALITIYENAITASSNNGIKT